MSALTWLLGNQLDVSAQTEPWIRSSLFVLNEARLGPPLTSVLLGGFSRQPRRAQQCLSAAS